MKEALFIYGTTGLGDSEFSADLLWRTGFHVPDATAYFEIDGKKILLASPLEVERAAKEATVDEVVLAEPREKSKTSSGSFLVDFLKERGVTKLVVPEYVRYSLVKRLGEFFEIEVRPDPFYPERAIKTEREVREIEKSQRAAEAGVRKAMEFLRTAEIRDGHVYHGGNQLTSRDLRNIIDDELYRQGCLGVETIVACGAEAADPHCKGYGAIRAGEPIVMDVFPRSLETLYFADMTRTVFKGEPSADMKKMYEAVLKAQEETIAMIGPGIKGNELDKKAREILEAAGFPTNTSERPMRGFIHSLGHGVGIEIHEAPSLSSRPDVLEAGNVVTDEPGLYYPAALGDIPEGGIRIEDMILVTKDGHRNLTDFSKQFHDVLIP